MPLMMAPPLDPTVEAAPSHPASPAAGRDDVGRVRGDQKRKKGKETDGHTRENKGAVEQWGKKEREKSPQAPPRRNRAAFQSVSPSPPAMSLTPAKTPAKPRPSKRILESYTIKGSDGVINPGDAVLMKAPDSSKRPYVARVEEIEATGPRGSNVRVKVRWYYRPEESMGGRRPFHGSKEVFLSDHQDVQSANTIECKCNVYSFKEYTKLDAVNAEDYFCRFEYKSITGSFVPDRIAVFCKCEMPYNPDDLMIQCDECSDWFHPACIGKTIKEAKKLENFSCESCAAENEKKVESPHESTGQSEEKQVESKRRRR